jgi:hypothetical protein
MALELLADWISFERKRCLFLSSGSTSRQIPAPSAEPDGRPSRRQGIPGASLHWSRIIAEVKELEPMGVLAVTKLPRGPDWSGELKLDEFAREFYSPQRRTPIEAIEDNEFFQYLGHSEPN